MAPIGRQEVHWFGIVTGAWIAERMVKVIGDALSGKKGGSTPEFTEDIGMMIIVGAVNWESSMIGPELGSDVSELFRRIVEHPSAATNLVEKFVKYSDQTLFDLFKDVKVTTLPEADNWA